jgi:hypothetical protein
MWDKFVEYIKSKFTLKAIWDTIIANNPIAYTIDIGKWLLGGLTDFTVDIAGVELPEPTVPDTTPIGSNIISGVQTGVDTEAETFSWKKVWDIIVGGFKSLLRIPESPSGLFTDFGVDVVDGFSKGITDQIAAITWDDIWQVIIDGFKLLFGIGSESTVFNGFGVETINGLKTGIVDTINSITGPEGTLTIAFNNLITTIKGFFGIGKKIEDNPFYMIGKSIIDGIVSGLSAFMGTLQSKIAEIAALMPAWMRELIGAESPSKVFSDIGKDMMLGMAEGIKNTSDIVKKEIGISVKNPSVKLKGKSMLDPYAALEAALKVSKLKNRMQLDMKAPMNATPVYGNTVNFGDVHITDNAMSWAVFKAQVQRAIVEL